MRTARRLRTPDSHRSLTFRLAAVGFYVFAFWPTGAAAGPVAGSGDLTARLRATLTRLPHHETVCSACVIDLATGRAVFEVNADAPLTPASTMKVFSMVAALVELGPDFAFETVLATDGRNLIVVGDGDPGFGDERIHAGRNESIYAPFDRWAQSLVRTGRTSFAGLVIDETIFDDQRTHPTWEAEDLGKWFAAPVGGLNLNDNCVDITLAPRRPDELVSVSTRPETSLIQVKNNCRTGPGQPVLHHAFGSFEYEVSGKCAKNWPFGAAAFPDPGLLFAESLRTRLAKRGIQIDGDIIRARVRLDDGSLPSSLEVIDGHRTPLADCLARAGKNSQNLFAECLLKRAGFEAARRAGASESRAIAEPADPAFGAPALMGNPPLTNAGGTAAPNLHPARVPRGSWELGAATVHRIARSAGIDPAGLSVADGSGLSRANACTARQLAAILAWSQSQPFARVLHDSLAEAGVDGSLRRRLKNLDGRVHAKTGTMRSVRTLAGYVDADSGPRFTFAILFNNYKGSSTPYKEIQDRFCRVLAEACEPAGK
jgi:D-alanyl-D-alanine carboxypeptidase/D-alanyl-D-alanine-endopeptidase (penicillin-binding protein 4)